MKKPLALILAVCLLLCLFAGCGNTAETTETPEEETTTEAETPAYMTELQEKMNTYPGDTVVMTVDGQEITWDLFYYMIASGLTEFVYYLGDLPADFSMEVSEGYTMESYFNDMSKEQCKLLGALLAKAAEYGVTPASETDEEIVAGWEEVIAMYGSEEALVENSFLTKNAYLQIMRFDLSNAGIQTKMYGTEGELFSEEDALAWAEENSYVHVKHILYQFNDAEGNPLDEAAKAEKMAEIEAIHQELKALEGDTEALVARFDEIMNADSADIGGLTLFPNGYTFTTGEMVPEFEEAAFALGDYEVSAMVESSHGVHILLGIPMGPDDLTMNQSGSGYSSLRELAISADYNGKMTQWIADAEVVWAEGFEEFSVLDLFPDRTGSGALVNEAE